MFEFNPFDGYCNFSSKPVPNIDDFTVVYGNQIRLYHIGTCKTHILEYIVNILKFNLILSYSKIELK